MEHTRLEQLMRAQKARKNERRGTIIIRCMESEGKGRGIVQLPHLCSYSDALISLVVSEAAA